MVMKIEGMKSAWECKFHTDCKRCAMRGQCISASTLSRDLRYHFLYVKGVRFPPSPEMTAGTLKHEAELGQYKTIDQYKLYNFKKDLKAGKKIELQEVRICNPLYSLRGVIDYLNIQLKDNKLHIKIVDLKSSWHKSYIFQVAAYAMMMRHPATRVCINGKIPRGKDKPRVESHIMLPRYDNMNRDIDFGIKIFGAKKTYNWEYMKDNMITEIGNVMKMNVEKKLKKFRAYNKYGLFYLNEIPVCKECFVKCGYYPECAKAWPVNGKKEVQLHFGRKQLLIFSRPVPIKKSLDK